MTATVIPFPPPSRPVLQASLHGRGARPYHFVGRVDDYQAPGTAIRKGLTTAAVDAAWLVEAALGRPVKAAAGWPGVSGAAERARAFGASVGAYQYQQEGAAFLAERDYAALLDAMGVGKTVQALIAAEARLSLGVVPTATTPCVLILCPALAKRHWEREVKRWTGHEAAVLMTLRPDELPQTRYVIANYDILHGARRRDGAGVLHDDPELPGWAGVLARRFMIAICDESHCLRGRGSQRTKAVRKILDGVPVVWFLSGTIMPNYVRDLWAQIDVLTDGLHGPYWDWCKKYTGAYQAKYGWIDTGSDNLDELGKRLGYFMLGRSKEAVQLQLPEKRRELVRVDVEITAPTPREAADALAKQKVVAGALRATARAKRPAVVAQALEALHAKQKVIVYTYLREQAEMVAKGIKAGLDCTVLCVHGDLSPDGRDAQAAVFREAAAPTAFVATVDSVGMAISLVGADLVLFGDLLYEPWKLLQAEARAHRHGSTCRVLVRYLIATGTIDEAVAEAVLAKLAVLEEAMGAEADAAGLTEMLMPDGSTTAAIVENLFEKLRGGTR